MNTVNSTMPGASIIHGVRWRREALRRRVSTVAVIVGSFLNGSPVE